MLSQQQQTNSINASVLTSHVEESEIIPSTLTTMLEQSSLTQDLEELDLEQEWAGILGDKSELDFLAFAGKNV